MKTVIDLFSGPGGLSLGFQQAGFRITTAIDNEVHCCHTHEHNFPKTLVINKDIGELDPKTCEPQDPDVIIGGPPCQGFSSIGRTKIASLIREGTWKLTDSRSRFIDDPRNVLYKHFIRFVDALKPSFFLMENVPGMMSYANGEIVRQIIQDFTKIGYKTDAEVLTASNYGVPQVRKRIFFLGNRLDLPNKFPEITHSDSKQMRLDGTFPKAVVTVGEAIMDLPKIPAGGGAEEMDYTIPLKDVKIEYVILMRKNSTKVYNNKARTINERDAIVFPYFEEGMWFKDLPPHIMNMLPYRKDIFHDKLKRLDRSKPSWTVVAHLYKDGYMYIHPTQTRTITVREAARLQSFPDRFRFMGARVHQFKQVGNAVPPLLAKAIASEILRSLE